MVNRRRRLARYVDGFVFPVPKRNIAAYKRLAKKAGKVWREYGALEYRESMGDDLKAQGVMPFPRAVRAKRGETVFFSWVLYTSRAHRDSVTAKVLNDPRLQEMNDPKLLPFDVRRMAYGGFTIVVDL